jgi:hypothetical protein
MQLKSTQQNTEEQPSSNFWHGMHGIHNTNWCSKACSAALLVLAYDWCRPLPCAHRQLGRMQQTKGRRKYAAKGLPAPGPLPPAPFHSPPPMQGPWGVPKPLSRLECWSASRGAGARRTPHLALGPRRSGPATCRPAPQGGRETSSKPAQVVRARLGTPAQLRRPTQRWVGGQVGGGAAAMLWCKLPTRLTAAAL